MAQEDWVDALFPQGLESQKLLVALTDLLGPYLPMSQQELADQMDLARGTINQWRNGKVRPSVAQQRKVCGIIRERLAAIEAQIVNVEEMAGAIETVERAYQNHLSKLDDESWGILSQDKTLLLELVQDQRDASRRNRASAGKSNKSPR